MPDPFDNLAAADRHLAEGLAQAYEDAREVDEDRARQARATFPGLFAPTTTEESK
ncbi:hypothetical protein [Kineococcus arenarius]|uniref:hypothetical protein n=1 Tax=unclassified Kineococcus TaxID=2621656 RepID=UPI003D7E8C32